MDIICRIVLIIFSSSVTGSIVTVIWFLFKKLFRRFLRSDIVYFALKFVLICYFVPVMAIAFAFNFYCINGFETYYLFFTNNMQIILCTIFVVIVALLFAITIHELKDFSQFKKMMKLRIPVKVNIKETVKELCEKMNIDRDFELYQGFLTPTPFIIGFIKPKIYLPMEELSEEDLKYSIKHELNHYIHHDNFWKLIMNIMFCFNWYNPFAWYMKKQMSLWSEVNCDYKCIIENKCDGEQYFNMIVDMIYGANQKYGKFASTAGIKNTEAYKRITLFKEYSKNEIKKEIVRLILITGLAASCITVYAATSLSELLINEFFNISSEENEEYEKLCDDGYIEYTRKAGDMINDEEEFEEAFSYSDLTEFEDSYNSNEILLKGEERIISVVNVDENGIINIVVISEDKESLFAVGIIEPDGTQRYVDGNKMITHKFEVDKKGYHKIFVINNGDKEVEANVSILYWHE